jgi:predicted dienelactone hydrolase
MQQYCRSEEARMDKGCLYARQALAPPSSEAASRRSFTDSRIRAIVALDPALGPAHSTFSLSLIRVPVHVVGAVENDFLPYEHHAARYARTIPGASHTRLTRGEGHFVFLNQCKTDNEVNGVPLCKDREGVQREEVHARLAVIIQSFFDVHLKSA